ncbi:MAG: DNA primase [Flavobacteriales bacterium]|nr:DNA primase [Flavobacteriales bacterium]
MIGQQTIDQIYSAARIDEVVGEFVKLKRSGSGFQGLCPFHNEKTPSFRVTPSLNIYKCFGCGKGGTVVDFIMEHEKFTYPEALRYLANRYHIEIEEDQSNKEELSEQVQIREGLYAALEFARKFFIQKLFENEDENKGLNYFRDRGLNGLSIDEFALGYAPAGWRNFTDHALKNGFTPDVLTRAGLIKRKPEASETSTEPEDYYDAYRDRVIFPIHGVHGKVLGFGGRQLEKNDKSPKYINSPENEVYHKSQVLYGLYQARHELRKRDDCFLVEGYMDVVMLHQSGIRNAVATSGTALTANQVKLIRRFTDNVTLLYDGDNAGLKAALRGLDLLLEEGLNAHVVVFPDGEDPDSYCRKLGGQGLDDFITSNKKDIILFMAELLLEEHGTSPNGIAQTADHIVQTLNRIQDPIKRNAYIRLAAETLHVDEELLFDRARKAAGRNLRTKSLEASRQQVGILLPKVEKDPKKVKEEGDKELQLLVSLMKYGVEPMTDEVDVATYVFSELHNDKYVFENNFVGQVIQEAFEYFRELGKLDLQFFLKHKDLGKMVADALAQQYELSPKWSSQFEINVKTDRENYREEIKANLYYLKLYKVDEVLRKNELDLKQAKIEEDIMRMQRKHSRLLELRSAIAHHIGNVVLR